MIRKRINQGTTRMIMATGLLVVFVMTSASYGVSACPRIYDLKQPDGAVFKATPWGDENRHGWKTADGYTILKDQKQYWVYAMQGTNGSLVPSSTRVNGAVPEGVFRELRPTTPVSKKTISRVVPAIGTANVPVLVINFSDTTLTYDAPQFQQLLFGHKPAIATGPGSMKDFYLEVSYGKLTLSEGPSGVKGGLTATGKHADYSSDYQAAKLVKEAVLAADAAGFDFSKYDNDNDGEVDAVAVIHQGQGYEFSGDSNDIWSHSWSLSSAGVGAVTVDGKTVNNYIIQPEIQLSNISTIGVFCHEFGHALGLPDLYDYTGWSAGVGYFCLMGRGSWNGDWANGNYGDTPAEMSAWCKVTLGWINPTEIIADGNYILPAVETTPKVYKLHGDFVDAKEYYLVENKQGAGFDSYLPGIVRGILIWHIDENQSDNNDYTHFLVDLEEAGGNQDLEEYRSSGDDEDYYRAENNDEFSEASNPNTLSYDGQTFCNINILDISSSREEMSFTVAPIPPRLRVNLIGTAHVYGTVTPLRGIYTKGEVITLTAEPEHGYQLKSWSGTDNDNSKENVNTVTMTKSKVITVEFERKTDVFYTITADVVGGNGKLWPLDLTYLEDTQVVVSCEPDSGYQVKQWTGTDNDTLKTTTNLVTMTSNKNVTVEFEPVPASATSAVGAPAKDDPSAKSDTSGILPGDLSILPNSCTLLTVPVLALTFFGFLVLVRMKE